MVVGTISCHLAKKIKTTIYGDPSYSVPTFRKINLKAFPI